MPLIPTDHPWARQDGVAAAAAASAAAEDVQQDGEDDRIEALPGDEKKDDVAVAVRLSASSNPSASSKSQSLTKNPGKSVFWSKTTGRPEVDQQTRTSIARL